MRRMITNKQVVDIVNKGIEEGEIEAGGLTPEQKEKIDNSLQLPESAPAAQQLVGINTSGEQNALGIGDGLAVVDGELQIDGLKILVVDANNAGLRHNFEITEDQYTKLQNHTCDILVIKNTGISSADKSGTYIFTYQRCDVQSRDYNYLYDKMYYMTTATITTDFKGMLVSVRQYLAELNKSGTAYTIRLNSCGGSAATNILDLRAYNGGLSGDWDWINLGEDPIQALKNHVIEFTYVDSTNKGDPNALFYEAIPVFYTHRIGPNGEKTTEGRVTFYSAPGVVFKDFYISFTKNQYGHTIKWNLTEITQ